MKIKDLPKSDRPRERLIAKGADNLKDSELLAIIAAHNHPSGDPKPSEDDLELTKRLTEAGKMMGIEVVDHVIISKNSHFSFKEEKLL